MNIEKELRALEKVIVEQSTDRTVAVRIFVGQRGCVVEIEDASPDALMLKGISMRNLRGEFIEHPPKSA